MKKILIILFCITVLSVGCAQSNSPNKEQTKKDEWQKMQNQMEEDGYKFVTKTYLYTIKPNVTNYTEASLYVKIINGKSFYRIELNKGVHFDITENPHYNPNGKTRESEFTHKVIHQQDNGYVNIN
ncbi:MAG: hypothetical protein FWC34_02535 [Bacteroidetes bacterium]|nr:hypothetical protein [Bacteroidota bacterium]